MMPNVLATAAYILSALAATVHAALRKRNVRAALGWIGLSWFAPILGPTLYFLFGINRIERTATVLARRHGAFMRRPGSTAPRKPEAEEMLQGGLRGLHRLSQRVTGNDLLPHNSIEPLEDGDEAYPAMLAAIDGAVESVTLSSYIFDCDSAGKIFIEALARATARGVQVRVLVDALGARYSKVSAADALRKAGVPAALFMPTRGKRFFRYANLRNHRKLMVADGSIGFTGGMNIREGHWIGNKPAYPIRCLHFRVRGPVVADLQRTFAADWAFTTGEALSGRPWFAEAHARGPVYARGIPDGPDSDMDNMQLVILGALAAARERVRIVTPYFLPDEAITAALKTASLRGVEMDIILPERSNIFVMDWAMRPQLKDLLDRGCRISLTPPPFDHAKLFTVDGAWSLIGSTNWDVRSLRLNFEYNLECYDPTLAQRLDRLADRRLGEGRLLRLEELDADPLQRRLRDGLARLLTPYL